MFASLLRFVGFPAGKPVHSRAEEAGVARPNDRGHTAGPDPKSRVSVRRPVVNAKTVKPAKAPQKAKAVQSTAAKAPATATKTPRKPAAKPVAAPAAKAKKRAAKPVVTLATTAKKSIAKPTATSTTAAKKPAGKPASTMAKKAVSAAKKPPSKLPAAKTPSKSPVQTKKSAAPAPVKVAAKKPVATKTAPSKPQPPTPKVAATPKAKSPVNPSLPKSVPATPVAVPLAPVVATAFNNVVPIKSGRPSSRLAQLTVPSMAQSVASTAAKASYGPSNGSPTIALVIPAIVKKDSKLANNWKTKSAAQLSDAELMAMPDSEYMNETQLAAFRLKLSALKLGILNSAGETTEHLREDTSVVPDPADRATIEEEHALELRTRDRERKLLKKIEQSIARIDAGDYGYCDETGEPIGVGRLLARPTATLSLEAQQRRELKQKMFGD